MAPPIVMGAWSMAFLLGQHVSPSPYYYYNLSVRKFGGLYYVIDTSVPSLHRESTDSLIPCSESKD